MRKTFGFGITSATTTVANGAYMRNVSTMAADARAGSRGNWSCVGPPARPSATWYPPAVSRGLPAASLKGLGDLGRMFCTELGTVVDALKVQLRIVYAKKGNDFALSNSTTQSVAAFINRYEDSTFAAPVYANNCTSAVENGRNLLRSLNSITSNIFGGEETLVPGGVQAEGGLFDALGSVKTIAIAGAVIAGVVLVAPFAFKFLKR